MIERELGLNVDLEPGGRGQFDVFVDGELLELPPKGFWQRFLTGRWPDEGEVVRRLRARAPVPASRGAVPG